jgi:phosphate acetyltransferase/phosphate butyryltransferase
MSTTTALQPDNLGTLRHRTFDEIAVGDTESMERTLTARDIQLYAILSGDENPQHLDAQFAASTRFHGVIAHGMWAGSCAIALMLTQHYRGTPP